MANDKLFQKRKAKSKKDIARKAARISPYDRVLIVCEGEKTEPYYFEDIKIHHDIDSANIVIDGNCGSSPISVVKHAFNIFEKECLKGGNYNKVFCVFDRDSHQSFDDAIKRINEINKNMGDKVCEFHVIKSTPSFEYWLLLHFTPTTRPFSRTENKSPADNVIDELRSFIPDYKKNQRGFYSNSVSDGTLDHAKSHSERIYNNAVRSGDYNPSTNMHEIVIYLENIKKDKNKDDIASS